MMVKIYLLPLRQASTPLLLPRLFSGDVRGDISRDTSNPLVFTVI
jgi:hypothetical protein